MSDLLIRLYTKPALAASLTSMEWTQVVSFGRDQRMLGRLWWRLMATDQVNNVPVKVRVHFENAAVYAEQQEINIHRELNEIARSFSSRGINGTILKGAAYISLNSNAKFGRVFNDIDLLVSKEQLHDAEIALMTLGWFHQPETDYDKRYFREWMHEIQPLLHHKRLTTVDLHHNILPKTNKKHFDANLLNKTTSNIDALNTLDSYDRFIHSATHLFTEGEFKHPIRDITDLIILYQELPSQEQQALNESQGTPNWSLLLTRAEALGLSQYVLLALYFVLFYLEDKDAAQQLKLQLEHNVIMAKVTLPAYELVFKLDDTIPKNQKHSFGLFWLYMRSHLIKMPLHVLIPHICRKFIHNMKEKFKEEPVNGANK